MVATDNVRVTGSARQHYYPAALIGQFSSSTKGKARNRPVWVARRGVERVFRSTGDRQGFRGSDPQMYNDRGGSSALERVWAQAERGLTGAVKMAEIAERLGVLPAEWFVLTLAPFVAHLLVRHPEIHLGRWSRLDSTSPDQDQVIAERLAAFGVAADTLLHQRSWRILTTTPDEPFVSSDLGWQWIPGAGAGEIFVPVSRTHAFAIRGGDPSYFYGDEIVAIDHREARPLDVAFRRDALAFTAPTEVYAPDEEAAQRVLDLWEGRRQIHLSDGNPIDAEALPRTSAELTGMVLAGGHHPKEAADRFIASNHLFSCGHRGNRDARRAHQREIDRQARSMRRRPPTLPNPALEILASLPDDKLQLAPAAAR